MNWDLDTFWAWAQLLQDPRDKQASRHVEAGLISAWEPEPWQNPPSATYRGNSRGWTWYFHDGQ